MLSFLLLFSVSSLNTTSIDPILLVSKGCYKILKFLILWSPHVSGINDVLTWFCLNHPNARFCRTLVLSGFTLRHFDSEISSESIINDANSRLTAMLKLGEYGMLGEYQERFIFNYIFMLFPV